VQRYCGAIYRYLLGAGMPAEEYWWFMQQRDLRTHCIMGTDYYITNEHVLRPDGRVAVLALNLSPSQPFEVSVRLDTKRVAFVFNHNQPFAVLGREQFESALEATMLFELPHAGEAAYKAASRGEPLVLNHSGSAYSKAIEKLVHLLVPAEQKAPHKRGLSGIGAAKSTATPTNGLVHAMPAKRAS